MNPEQWKWIVGFEPLYQVSNLGRVRAMFDSWNGRYKSGRIIKPLKHTHGYLAVGLHFPGTDKKPIQRLIHRLVLEAFVGPAPEGCEVRHLDGTRTNNDLSNLKWGTRAENVQDAIGHGTFVSGEKSNFAKLTPEIVLKIRSLFDHGTLSHVIAKEFNISIPQAWRIGNRKSWMHL